MFVNYEPQYIGTYSQDSGSSNAEIQAYVDAVAMHAPEQKVLERYDGDYLWAVKVDDSNN